MKKSRSEQIAAKAKRESLEQSLLTQIRQYGLPEGVPQYRAVPGRRWAWDRSWPEYRLLVEVQGGITSSKVKGPDGYTSKVMGHNSISGILRDHEKHNAATLLRWFVIYANTITIRDGSAIKAIADFINKRDMT